MVTSAVTGTSSVPISIHCSHEKPSSSPRYESASPLHCPRTSVLNSFHYQFPMHIYCTLYVAPARSPSASTPCQANWNSSCPLWSVYKETLYVYRSLKDHGILVMTSNQKPLGDARYFEVITLKLSQYESDISIVPVQNWRNISNCSRYWSKAKQDCNYNFQAYTKIYAKRIHENILKCKYDSIIAMNNLQ
jgi:hypothetical protein